MKPKRKKPFAATNATRKSMEALGFVVGIVEQTIPHTFIKRDFLGFADLIAASNTGGIIAIQVTGGGNLAARRKKILAEPRARAWISAGGRIQIHDWVKRAGEKKRVCRVEEVTA
jgi:hypothetical protein